MRRTQDSTPTEPKSEVTADRTIKASEVFYIPHFSPKRGASSIRAITSRQPSLVRGATNAVIETFRDLFNF